MLARLGMFRLAKGIMNEPYDKMLLAQDETEISKMLKIDRSRLKRLAAMDANVNIFVKPEANSFPKRCGAAGKMRWKMGVPRRSKIIGKSF